MDEHSIEPEKERPVQADFTYGNDDSKSMGHGAEACYPSLSTTCAGVSVNTHEVRRASLLDVDAGVGLVLS